MSGKLPMPGGSYQKVFKQGRKSGYIYRFVLKKETKGEILPLYTSSGVEKIKITDVDELFEDYSMMCEAKDRVKGDGYDIIFEQATNNRVKFLTVFIIKKI